MRRLIVLGTGLLGSALRQARPDATVLDHAAFDQAGGLARATEPHVRAGDAVVNAAAMTNLDKCEERPDQAMEVNGEEPGRLARLCRERGALLAHVSTDGVLDPINVYSQSKVLGEQRVKEEAGDDALIVRISTVFGPHPIRDDFVRFVVRTLRTTGEVRAITDMICSPTYTLDAARAMIAAVEGGARGTHAFVNEPSISRYDFARLIQEVWRAPGVVRGVTMDEFKGFKARRPRDTTMHATLDRWQKPMPLRAALEHYCSLWP